MVRDLELEVRGRRRRKDRDKVSDELTSVRGSHREASRQSRDRSQNFIDRDSVSLERRRPWNAVMDAMSCALRRGARSLFSDEIE